MLAQADAEPDPDGRGSLRVFHGCVRRDHQRFDVAQCVGDRCRRGRRTAVATVADLSRPARCIARRAAVAHTDPPRCSEPRSPATSDDGDAESDDWCRRLIHALQIHLVRGAAAQRAALPAEPLLSGVVGAQAVAEWRSGGSRPARTDRDAGSRHGHRQADRTGAGGRRNRARRQFSAGWLRAGHQSASVGRAVADQLHPGDELRNGDGGVRALHVFAPAAQRVQSRQGQSQRGLRAGAANGRRIGLLARERRWLQGRLRRHRFSGSQPWYRARSVR